MTREIFPENSKGSVNRAGQKMRFGKANDDDTRIVENWRAAHNHILNTFQANLRIKAKRFNVRSPVQRIKRLKTITSKLNRYPSMKLARMHDIVGCRLIFETKEALDTFRNEFNRSRFEHKRRVKFDENNKRLDAYNYITHPKSSGYRGIHDVFEYSSKPTGGHISLSANIPKRESAEKWNGLNIEIQYRTNVQHAWATAVEICDTFTSHHGKFSEAPEEYLQYFRLASELLARIHENQTGCLVNSSTKEILSEFLILDKKHAFLSTLRGIQPSDPNIDTQKNTLIIINDDTEQVDVESFKDFREAIRRYFELEKDTDSTVVLVTADDSESVRYGFKNYFSDAREFVSLMDRAIKIASDKY